MKYQHLSNTLQVSNESHLK